MKQLPEGLPPLPEGAVYLGRGGTFKRPNWGLVGHRVWVESGGIWMESECYGGDDGTLHYAAPADSEVARLNEPTPEKYLIWCRDRGEPTKFHDSLESAETEAKRLAGKHPNVVYHIAKVVAAYKGEVTVTKL